MSSQRGHRVVVENAVKRYGAKAALDGIDLDVAAGRFLVLLGPSGSGKSTLLRSVAGIERLDTGIVRLGGALASDHRRHVPPERRDLAMVFQDYALWPHLSALGNVAYALRRRRLGRGETERKAAAALERVGLGGLAGRYPHELSGGEQQRVGLARAIVAEPALLLFDEPLSNLDADLRERMRVEIATLARASGSTAVYITHDQSEAFALADEIGVLHDGRIEQLGPPEQIYTSPATPFVAQFTGMSGQLDGRVVSRRDGNVLVRVGAECVEARLCQPVATGAAVTVLVRPAATALVAEPVEGTVGTLRGTVIDTAYRGRGYDHVVACADATLTSVFDPAPWPRGGRCGIRLSPTGATAFATAAVTDLVEGEPPRPARDPSGAVGQPLDLTAVSIMSERQHSTVMSTEGRS